MCSSKMTAISVAVLEKVSLYIVRHLGDGKLKRCVLTLSSRSYLHMIFNILQPPFTQSPFHFHFPVSPLCESLRAVSQSSSNRTFTGHHPLFPALKSDQTSRPSYPPIHEKQNGHFAKICVSALKHPANKHCS